MSDVLNRLNGQINPAQTESPTTATKRTTKQKAKPAAQRAKGKPAARRTKKQNGTATTNRTIRNGRSVADDLREKAASDAILLTTRIARVLLMSIDRTLTDHRPAIDRHYPSVGRDLGVIRDICTDYLSMIEGENGGRSED